MANGEILSPVINGLPQWARLIMWLGFPTIIAMVLLGVLLGVVSTPLQKIDAVHKQLEQHVTDSKTLGETQTKLIRQICRNTSKSELGTETCNNL